MKLRYLANVRLPTEKAHGIQIMAMCQAFARAGADVELVVPARSNPLRDDPFAYYGMKPTFAIRRLPVWDLLRWEKWLGSWVYQLEKWSFARAALRDARERPADAYYHRDDLVFAEFCRAGLPSVWEAHDVPGRNMPAIAACGAGRVVAITQGLSQALVERGVAASRIMVAPDGVDLEMFSHLPSREAARQALGWNQSEFIALYTGQLFPWKGVDTLVEAARDWPPNVRAKIVGGGARLAELSARAKALGAAADFVGQRPHEDIPACLAAADVVLIPTSGREPIGRAYTSPLKLFEAMAASRAIIASDLPSLREVLDDACAHLVQADNPQAWHDAVFALSQDAESRSRLAAAAHERARQFDWTERARRILAFLPASDTLGPPSGSV